MCALTPQKTRFEFKVRWTRSKRRKKEKVFTLYILTGKDQWVNLRFAVGQKVTLNTLILCQELHRSFSSILGAGQCCDQPCSSLGQDHLVLGAVTTWFAVATEERASSAVLQVCPQRPQPGCGNRLLSLPSRENHKTQPTLVTVKPPLKHY